MPSWMFKEESNRGKTKNREKKKPAQIKKNDNCATEDIKVQEGTTEGKCVAGQVLTRAQAKNSDKIHPLKVKEAMSSLGKTTIEDLQKKDSTVKTCFDQVGKPILERTMLGSSSLRMDYFIGNIKRRKQEEVQQVNCTKVTSTTSCVRESRIRI